MRLACRAGALGTESEARHCEWETGRALEAPIGDVKGRDQTQPPMAGLLASGPSLLDVCPWLFKSERGRLHPTPSSAQVPASGPSNASPSPALVPQEIFDP